MAKFLRASAVAGLAGAVGVATYIAVSAANAARTPESPKIVLPSLALYLGKGKAGEIVDGVFKLRNAGNAPLPVSLSASCGCSQLSPRVASIPPGESADFRVGIRLSDDIIEKAVSIGISSNDPASPDVSYQVRVTCVPPLDVRPSRVDFGHPALGKGASRDVVVRGDDGKPLPADAKLEVVTRASVH
jgi:hypothetical protein